MENSNKEVTLQVVDDTGNFTEAQRNELLTFIINELLSSEEIKWLKAITILDEGPNGSLGSWYADFLYDESNQIVIGVRAAIVLNYFYFSTFDKLKETLAHEYGHHWTLSYLAVNQGIDYKSERIPREYYQLRGLNKQDYAHDYSKHWENCDKEIIAEDYRVLFAPNPYNQNHEMVVNYGRKLKNPNQQVQEYIRNLKEDNKSESVRFFLRKIIQKFSGDR